MTEKKTKKNASKKAIKKSDQKPIPKTTQESHDQEKDDEVYLSHAIILNKAPYYVLADNEATALDIAKYKGSDVVGIIVAPSGLSMKAVQIKTILADIEIKRIPQFIKNDDGTYEEVKHVDIDPNDLSDEEKDILDLDKSPKDKNKSST